MENSHIENREIEYCENANTTEPRGAAKWLCVNCDVCGGGVINGPDYYNGMNVDGFGHVCKGCMLAAGVRMGERGDGVVRRLEEYRRSLVSVLPPSA